MARIVLDVDRNKFFGMVSQVGGVDSIGQRLAELCLDSGRAGLRLALGLAVYGVEVVDESAPPISERSAGE